MSLKIEFVERAAKGEKVAGPCRELGVSSSRCSIDRLCARSYRHVDSILKSGLDRVPSTTTEKNNDTPRLAHENVRERDRYHGRSERMLNEPTLDKLRAMRLEGMVASWLEQQKDTASTKLAFDERFGMRRRR